MTRGGLFLLTLLTAYGQAQAQVFFLQGEPGVCTNTINGDLTVAGQIQAGGDVTVTGKLTVDGSIQLPDCLSGYVQDLTALPMVLCVDPNGDEMVKVGDFWIDRYEVRIWELADCSGNHYGTGSDNWPGVARWSE